MRWWLAEEEHGRGTSDPIVARTVLQARKLIGLYELTEKNSQGAVSVFNNVRRHLHQCDDIAKELVRDIKEKSEQLPQSLERGQETAVIRLPAASNLTNSVETYLYHAKLVFRELKGVFKYTLGKGFKPTTQYNHIADWSQKRFGNKNKLSKWLRGNCDWVQKVIDSRNAVEHPEDHALEIRNFHIERPNNSTGYVQGPTWSLDGEIPKSLLKDMQVLTTNMLEFCEVLLVHCLGNIKDIYPIVIAEVPEERRNKDAPVRFVATLEQDLDENGFYKYAN